MKIKHSDTRQQRATPTPYKKNAPTFRGVFLIKGRNIKDEPPLAGLRAGFFLPPLDPLNGKGGAKQVKATNAEKENTVPRKRNCGNTSK